MKRFRLQLSVAAFAVLPIGTLSATAQEAFLLDEITVFANLAPTPLRATGTSVTIITEEDLRGVGDVQLSSYLSRLPGISVSQSGPPGSQTGMRIRGADQRYIAVYVDGVRVDDPSLIQTYTDFGTLTTADIGRVEVLRGSQSALYGGSAVGGVINITTRAAAESGLTQSFGLEGGSYGTVGARYGLTRRGDRGAFSFNLSHFRTDGFSAADENAGNPEADGFDTTRLSFSARHAISESLTLGASGFLQHSRIEYDGFGAAGPVDRDNVETRRQAGARIFAEFDTGTTLHEFEITGYQTRRHNDEENAFPPPARTASSFRGSRLSFGYKGTTEAQPDLTLIYGVDTTLERARYQALPDGSESTRISGVFAQALWSPRSDLDIAATARADRNSTFGTYTSGRLAVAWRPDPSLTVRAVAATGFRPPSIDERFGVYGAFVGNPALTPETSRSYEIGAEKSFGNGASLSGTLFRLDIDNLITAFFAFDPVTGAFTGGYNNLPGKSRRQGVELAASLPLGKAVALDAAYTYTDARNPAGGRLARVPRHELGLTLDARLTDRLAGSINLEHVRDRIDGFPLARMPNYTVVNTSASYSLTDRASLTLRVENLFDRQYQEVAGYGTSGRAAYLGISGRF